MQITRLVISDMAFLKEQIDVIVSPRYLNSLTISIIQCEVAITPDSPIGKYQTSCSLEICLTILDLSYLIVVFNSCVNLSTISSSEVFSQQRSSFNDSSDF